MLFLDNSIYPINVFKIVDVIVILLVQGRSDFNATSLTSRPVPQVNLCEEFNEVKYGVKNIVIIKYIVNYFVVFILYQNLYILFLKLKQCTPYILNLNIPLFLLKIYNISL